MNEGITESMDRPLGECRPFLKSVEIMELLQQSLVGKALGHT